MTTEKAEFKPSTEETGALLAAYSHIKAAVQMIKTARGKVILESNRQYDGMTDASFRRLARLVEIDDAFRKLLRDGTVLSDLLGNDFVRLECGYPAERAEKPNPPLPPATPPPADHWKNSQ